LLQRLVTHTSLTVASGNSGGTVIGKALIVAAVCAAFLGPAPAAGQSLGAAEFPPGVLIIQRIGVVGETSVRIAAAPKLTGDVYRATNFPLIALWYMAYGQFRGPMFGAPDWFYLDGFDITGRRHPGEEVTAFSHRALTDAFKFSMHFETRPVYSLVVAEGSRQLGPGIKEWTNESCPPNTFRAPKPLSRGEVKRDSIPSLDDVPCGGHRGVGIYAAGGISLEQLAEALSQELNVVVRNETGRGRTARFAVRLRWRSDASADNAALTSLLTALRDQLGLELRASENPADVVVIDHVEQPTVPGAVP
jgi:uncharacterized protein (TIGR03435 family)